MNKIILLCMSWFTACSVTQKQDEAISLLPYYATAEFTPEWLTSAAADTIHRIPAFLFINQYGKTVTEQTIAHKITVVDFFFTACPGICKKLTSNLALVQDAFKSDSTVLLLSHSVTPDYDSVPVLKKYAAGFKAEEGKWHFVTGQKDAVYSVARNAYFADEDLGKQKSSDDFLHTENLLLIDGDLHIRGIYKGTDPAAIKELINDISKLKNEL